MKLNKYVVLGLGLILIVSVIYSFVVPAETGKLFMFEVNIWVYRLIQGALGLIMLYDYSKRRNE